MFGLQTSLKLSPEFDVALLQRDLATVLQSRSQLIPHYGEYHDGGWSAIGLISQGGDETNLRAGGAEYRETAALAVAPYFREVIERIECRKQRVRLMALAPGARIFEHYDKEESLDAGVARLHLPVITSSKVEFYLAKRRQRWKAGELWYGDFSFPHHLWNKSDVTRVHMVLDCEVNDFLLRLFPPGYAERRRARQLYRNLLLTEFDWKNRLRAASRRAN